MNGLALGFTPLYLIEILHQTTTNFFVNLSYAVLYLIEILHQTTTSHSLPMLQVRCILSKFYIKPQLYAAQLQLLAVVSYRNSTSNHNVCQSTHIIALVVSYRNSTSNHNSSAGRVRGQIVVSYRNSTSNHNHRVFYRFRISVVSYRNSTSNHNA